MSCEEGKELVLAQVIRPGKQSGFYLVDLKADKVCKTPIATVLGFAGDDGVVCLGSLVYYVGGPTVPDTAVWNELLDGGHHIHTGTSYLELRSKQHLLSLLESKQVDVADCDDDPFKTGGYLRWKDAPPMSHPRHHPSCASLGGKIYVLGGSAPPSCIGEVFTPHSFQCGTGEWKRLPQPPNDLPLKSFCVSYPLIADEKNERLLVHFRNVRSLYAYYPANGGKWVCLVHYLRRWKRASVLVDGVLYSHCRGDRDCILAYDVMANLFLKVVYSTPFPVKVWLDKFENMLRLDDDMLCLANCLPFVKEAKVQESHFLFFKFRVKRTTPTEVHVTPDATNRLSLKNYVAAINFTVL